MPSPVCIGCSQPIGPGPRLNRLPTGKVCPTCRDRLMETVPAPLPAPPEELSLEDWAEEEGEGEYPSGA